MTSVRLLQGRIPRKSLAASGGLAAGTAAFQLALLAASVLVARAEGRVELGRYAAAIAITLVVVGGAGAGLPVLALREAAGGKLTRTLLTKLLVLQLVLTCLAGLLAVLIGAIALKGWAGMALVAIAVCGGILMAFVSLLNAVYFGLQRYRRAIGGQLLAAVLLVVSTHVALAGGLKTAGALAAIVGAETCCLAWLGTGLRRSEWPVGGDVGRILAKSVPLFSMAFVNGTYQRFDTLIVFTVSSAATAGTYASAYKALGPFGLIAAGFGPVFFSRLSALPSDDPEWHRLQRRGARLLGVSVLPLAALTALVMPWLVRVTYGQGFSSATTPARILLLSLVPNVLYIPRSYAMYASKRERELVPIVLGSVIVQCALMAWLAHSFGAAGAAWAWVLSESSVLVAVSWMWRRAPHPLRPAPGAMRDESYPELREA